MHIVDDGDDLVVCCWLQLALGNMLSKKFIKHLWDEAYAYGSNLSTIMLLYVLYYMIMLRHPHCNDDIETTIIPNCKLSA